MIDRREFLTACLSGAFVATGGARGAAGALGTAEALRAAVPGSQWPALQLSRGNRHAPRRWGIQLYTVRDQARADLAGTLVALAAMGYAEVEFAGLHGHPAAEVRRMLDRAGLSAPSGHVGMEALADGRIGDTIADAATLGHRFLVVPWIPTERRSVEGYAGVAETFNRAGQTVRAAGMTLGYHNHNFEFAAFDGTPDGRCGYDILLGRTDPSLVAMELDLFWIRKGGRDAFQYFRRYPGHFQLVHIKDMDAAGEMVDLGRGVIPWADLLDAAAAAGVTHWFAEHDEPADPMAFARGAVDYLRKLT